MVERRTEPVLCRRCGRRMSLALPDQPQLVDVTPFLREHLDCLRAAERAPVRGAGARSRPA